MPEISSVMIKARSHKHSDNNDDDIKKPTAKTMVFRVFLVIFTIIVLAVGGLLGVVLSLEFGPSTRARDLFVISAMETSAVKFLATSFLGEEKVDEIIKANSMQEADDASNPDLVQIGSDKKDDETDNNQQNPTLNIIPGSDNQPVDPDGDGIDIVDVSGPTFKGKMMIVYDPTRVFVGVSGPFGRYEPGKTIDEIYEKYSDYNVVAAINGGGWDDRPGHGTGGEPWGLVISEGELLWGAESSMATYWDAAGITEEGKLVVGTYTVQHAVDIGVQNAAKYGPTLIIDGEPMESLGSGSGLNPRTAIGQRADGAMLMLVIDGRQSNSLGASYVDVQNVMLDFEAVNAYNLDGGSSTSMIFNGEHINSNASLIGLRKMCTVFLVKGLEDGNEEN